MLILRWTEVCLLNELIPQMLIKTMLLIMDKVSLNWIKKIKWRKNSKLTKEGLMSLKTSLIKSKLNLRVVNLTKWFQIKSKIRINFMQIDIKGHLEFGILSLIQYFILRMFSLLYFSSLFWIPLNTTKLKFLFLL